jgi:hypothetical protein
MDDLEILNAQIHSLTIELDGLSNQRWDLRETIIRRIAALRGQVGALTEIKVTEAAYLEMFL